MTNRLHRIALFLVFEHRVQQSLDEMAAAWNSHPLRGEGYRSPNLLFTLSRQKAQMDGSWISDPGDDLGSASNPLYGVDQQDGFVPPVNELEEDPDMVQNEAGDGTQADFDEELNNVKATMHNFDCQHDDGNWGLSVYVQAIFHLTVLYPSERDEALRGSFSYL